MAATIPGNPFDLDEDEVSRRLHGVKKLVGKSLPEGYTDPEPGLIGEVFVGNKYHASNVNKLVGLGVRGVLNCAPSGIRGLPLDKFEANGIRYAFTNVAQDMDSYPILHDRKGCQSEHLERAEAFLEEVRETGGKVLFFCVAGQNRSATLAIAVQLLRGQPLAGLLEHAAGSRPFVVENTGFQRQLVELDMLLAGQRDDGGDRPAAGPASAEEANPKRARLLDGAVSRWKAGSTASRAEGEEAGSPGGWRAQLQWERNLQAGQHRGGQLAVELLVPGLCTLNLPIPDVASIERVKELLVQSTNARLAESDTPSRVGKAWLLFSMFGVGIENDQLHILEETAVECHVQHERLHECFGLEIIGDPRSPHCQLRWSTRSRFELVIFSVGSAHWSRQRPFTFQHQERPGAPGTLLAESPSDTHLRAWDFSTGEAYRSGRPIVFSFSHDGRSKRDFMEISSSRKGERQHFSATEGGVLGMGANAIVHRVALERRTPPMGGSGSRSGPALLPIELGREGSGSSDRLTSDQSWDAAVKRSFGLARMIASMDNKAEAGVAKRLRMAGALNQQGRLLYFYGLGIALASNSDNRDEYKFEAALFSQYQEDFSAYTLKQFMNDYTAVPTDPSLPAREKARLETLQERFTLIKVKVLLVSLLNGFRDLTLMGVQAFDFNHLDNVLISRDYRKARLIDIDGASKGSIQFPSKYISGQETADGDGDGDDEDDGHDHEGLHKPALDVDLNTLLPLVVQQLIFGKGRGKRFVEEQVSLARRARTDDQAKSVIKAVIKDTFFPHLNEPMQSGDGFGNESDAAGHRHLLKVVEWFHASLMRRSPWSTWTNDIYDAMRCIDHLPIS